MDVTPCGRLLAIFFENDIEYEGITGKGQINAIWVDASGESFTPKKASLPVEPDGERTDHYVLADDSSDDYVADSSQWGNYDDESPFGYDDGSFRDAFEDDYDAYLSRQ